MKLLSFLRSKRGSVSLAFTLAAIPIIGMAGLGTEAGLWYVIKRHSQNAADAAAYSGAMRLACDLGAITCTDTQTVDYRGKEFAAQNSFCNSGDTTAYPGSTCVTGYTQSVQIDIGTFSAGTFTTAAGGNAVRATVSQTQARLLSSLFLTSDINIVSQAVAIVENPSPACALALTTLTIGGNPTWGGGNCALVSAGNVKINSSPNFPAGAGWAVDGTTGCSTTSNCNTVGPNASYDWYAQPPTNPLESLDSKTYAVTTKGSLSNLKCSNGNTCNFTPTTLGGAAYGGMSITGGTVSLASGTYIFYNANINITGGTVTGTNINIVLLGNSSLTINGGAIVKLTANYNNSDYAFLDGVLLNDQGTSSHSNDVTINGGSGSFYGGAIYVPNNTINWDGNSVASNNCTEIIGNNLNITGTTTFGVSGCPTSVIPQTQIIALVQ